MTSNHYSRGGQHHHGAREGHEFYGNQYTDGRRGEYENDGRRYGDAGSGGHRHDYGQGGDRRQTRHGERDDNRSDGRRYGGEEHPRDEHGRFVSGQQYALGRSRDDYDRGERDRRDVSRRNDDDDYASRSGDYFNAIGHSHNDTRGGRRGGYHREEIHCTDRRDYEQAQRDYERDYGRHDYGGGGHMNASDSGSYRDGARQGSGREGEYPSYQGSYGIRNHERGDYRH